MTKIFIFIFFGIPLVQYWVEVDRVIRSFGQRFIGPTVFLDTELLSSFPSFTDA